MNAIPRLRLMACVLGIAFAWAPTLCADDKAALLDRLHRANDESALDASGIKPWHMKLSIQLYDAEGTPADKGSVEQWWVAPGVWRVVYALPDYAVTDVRNSTGHFRTKDAGSPSMLLQLLLDQMMHPMPSASEEEGATPELRKHRFGSVPLECIMLSRPMKNAPESPLGLFPTYCFDPGQDTLRVSYNFGSEFIVRNRLGQFQGKRIATDVMVNENGLHAASAKVETLAGTTEASARADAVSELMLLQSGVARVSGNVMAGAVLTKTPPKYPEGARQRHVSGAVVMHAIIGRDGHVHSLRFVSIPDPELGIAAVEAVRQWTYRPYLLNGLPTEVDTTITVNFNFGP